MHEQDKYYGFDATHGDVQNLFYAKNVPKRR